jgi:hypothetical protein
MAREAAGQRRDPFEEAARELQGPAEVSPPDLKSLGPGVGYVATFRQAMARVSIDGVRMGRDGLKGDVRVEIGPFGDGGYRTLTEGRLELPSISQRESWERRLRKRWPSTDWDAVLDRFCAAILQAEKRLDAPAILLRNAQTPGASGMLLNPLLLSSMPTIWYGDGGTAKSYLMLAAALSVHEGVAVIGRAMPARRLKVLIADFEFDDWEHRDRMRRLLHLQREDPSDAMPEIAYLDCKGGSIVSQVERIQAAAREFGSEYLVVDSISYAAEGPLNDDETARLYYRTLGRIGLPSLSTGHIPKNGNPDYPFGSVHWKNLSRLAWHFQVCEQERTDELHLKLTCKKVSTGERILPMGLVMRFAFDALQIETADPDRMVSGADVDWKRIRAAIEREGRAMTYAEICLATGLDNRTVGARISDHPDTFQRLPVDKGEKVRIGLKEAREW